MNSAAGSQAVDPGALQRSRDAYLEYYKKSIPQEKADHPILVGMIGLISSGKTTTARLLAERLTGAVVLRSDSARFVLQQEGLPWGDNVRVIMKHAAAYFIERSRSVILDGDYAESDKREELKKFANDHNIPLFFVRILLDQELSLRRREEKWERLERGEISQNMDHFSVEKKEKNPDNLLRRVSLHEELESTGVAGLLGELDNSGDIDRLAEQVDGILEELHKKLSV